MIVIDTHVLIWLDAGLDTLGTQARERLNLALQEDRLAVSAISFWEVGMLVARRRLQMRIDLLQWRSDLIGGGLQELAICGTVGIEAARLETFHGDPADRLIVATAIHQTARLATADKSILEWNGPIHCLDARR